MFFHVGMWIALFVSEYGCAVGQCNDAQSTYPRTTHTHALSCVSTRRRQCVVAVWQCVVAVCCCGMSNAHVLNVYVTHSNKHTLQKLHSNNHTAT